MEQNPSSSRADRKTIEKNRRNQMKALYSKLNSLVPHQSSRESVSLPDQLHEATNYIKKLQTNLEKMKEKKGSLMGVEMSNPCMDSGTTMGLRFPQIQVHDTGSTVQIVLITGLDDSQFIFNEIIRLLHEDGVEIANASFSAVQDIVFHSIHAEVQDSSAGGNDAAARISARLNKFVQDVSAN
ncbi:hypothetical protein Tsubulata_030120 [Turnera subulata]|uniref:BHLH domain-containing protein n=1 Tax=Turnera subulata TaxID=218843 RepID=A0A9Q0JF79_9ROSI|nr:hypothetical protein Tsubulata_030120 [Turnera subulata]